MIDPITITTTIFGIATKCVSVTKQLSDLRGKFAHAALTITAICAESSLIKSDQDSHQLELCLATLETGVPGSRLRRLWVKPKSIHSLETTGGVWESGRSS